MKEIDAKAFIDLTSEIKALRQDIQKLEFRINQLLTNANCVLDSAQSNSTEQSNAVEYPDLHFLQDIPEEKNTSISKIATNALRRAGFKTLEDLMYIQEKDLNSIRNLGKKGIDFILECCKENEISIGIKNNVCNPYSYKNKLVTFIDNVEVGRKFSDSITRGELLVVTEIKRFVDSKRYTTALRYICKRPDALDYTKEYFELTNSQFILTE